MSVFTKVVHTVCSGTEDQQCENFVQRKQLPAFKKHCPVCASKTKEVSGPNPIGYAIVAVAFVAIGAGVYWQVTSSTEGFLGGLLGDLISNDVSTTPSQQKSPAPAGPKEIAGLVAEGKYDEILQIGREALKSSPDDTTALTNVGSALLKLKKFDDAKPYLERAVKLKPNDPYLRYNLGAAEALLGQKDAAINHLRQACGLGLAPATFVQDPDFATLAGNPAFDRMITTKKCD